MTSKDFFDDGRFPLHWQMSLAERTTFISVLEKIQPKLSIEIGTYKGGSLQVLSHFSEKVIAVDINNNHVESLSSKFPNVDFRIGNSTEVLPSLISELEEKKITPDFVLVDGGHDEEQVKRDVDIILQFRPLNDITIICHDSFNPGCRRGILSAGWNENPFVHEVEVDFIPGHFFEKDFDTARRGEMWGGFAFALLSPEPRSIDLEIVQSRKTIFEAAYQRSIHRKEDSRMRQTARQISERWNRLSSYLLVRCRPARWIRSRFA